MQKSLIFKNQSKSILFVSDIQYGVTVKNSWKLHDTTRDKWYLLVAKTSGIKQRWLKAFEDERKRVKADVENSKI